MLENVDLFQQINISGTSGVWQVLRQVWKLVGEKEEMSSTVSTSYTLADISFDIESVCDGINAGGQVSSLMCNRERSSSHIPCP